MTGTAQQPKTTGPGLGTVRSAVTRHPLLAALAGGAAAAVAAAVWVLLPVPKMTGYTLFRIQANAPAILSPVDREDFNLFRNSQSNAITSRFVVNAALRNPAVADASMLRDHADKVLALQNLLKVDFKTGPEFMRLVVEGDDPEELRVIVTEVGEAYLRDVVNKKKTADLQLRTKLEQLEELSSREAERLSRQITSELEAQMLSSADDGRFYLRERKARLADEKLRLAIEIDVLLLQQKLLTDPAADPTKARQTVEEMALKQRLAGDGEYQKLDAERTRVAAVLEDARKHFRADRPNPQAGTLTKQMTDLAAQIAAVEARVKAEVAVGAARDAARQAVAARAEVEGQMRYKKARLEQLEQDLRELAADKLKATGDVFDLEGRRVRLNEQRTLLAEVRGKLTKMKLEAEAPDRVIKQETEVVPGVEGNKRLKYSLMAGLGVLGLGLAGLVARELRSPRVADARQLTGDLGLPVIGLLPLFDEHGGPAAVARAAVDGSLMQNLTALEAVNAACTALHHAPGGPAPKVILVASAVSGEGKTSVAMLLASSMAQAGYRTLLIDGDLRRPSVHAHFGLAPRPGLCDYLAGGGGELVQATDVPRLAVMAAGRWSRAASYALASGKRWQALLAEAAAQFEYVFVDSSPLLPVADGLLMARHVDAVVLSAMRGNSELEPLRDAVRQVESVNARVLGVVLNGVAPRTYYRYPYTSQPAEEVVPLLNPPAAPELAAGPTD